MCDPMTAAEPSPAIEAMIEPIIEKTLEILDKTGNFDRNAYQRAYMRDWRKRQKEKK